MLPFTSPLEPMLAEAQDEIPSGDGWFYEPKWDGFRSIVFRDGDAVHLCSRNGQPLERYFPDVVAGLKRSLPERIVIDGEIILPGEKGLDFDALGQRIHPAASRIKRLSEETPAGFVAFDCLALGDDDLREKGTLERRGVLRRNFQGHGAFFVTPHTMDAAEAKRWFEEFEGAGCDGVIARRVELGYRPGERVMVKIKHGRTVDVVVGAYREGKKPGTVGSLLLGLYDEHGVFHLVGHTSSFSAKEKAALVDFLKPYVGESFGEGRAPDQPNRWSNGKQPAPTVHLRPELVCEVRYDYLQGPRFRHAATFLRWRDDKNPKDCLFSQLLPPNPFSLEKIVALSPSRVAST
ncbi:MAG: ATP-dependent DNA ligase [Archangium gephyra]|uniref:DNA ligase (ATP) n=1 Tax=Archangium gephyra TaxID=48 RepID=A0A2W5TDF1_9BACT|nr:MAG: ATP-dependent DNA ligase [Archangium gephyra]